MSLLVQARINSLLMAEAVFTENSVYSQCCFPGMKAEDAIFRIVRALREVVAHVVSPEGMPALWILGEKMENLTYRWRIFGNFGHQSFICYGQTEYNAVQGSI